MRRILFALAVLLTLIVPAVVGATGPIQGPQKCGMEWIAPTTNTDGTPLTDLALYYVYVSSTTGQFTVVTATIPSPSTTPAPNTVIKWDCRTAGLTDGQKWATVKAVDTAGNPSVNGAPDPSTGGTVANGIPFVFDGLVPGSATGLKVSP